jgi:hypothetical protein
MPTHVTKIQRNDSLDFRNATEEKNFQSSTLFVVVEFGVFLGERGGSTWV